MRNSAILKITYPTLNRILKNFDEDNIIGETIGFSVIRNGDVVILTETPYGTPTLKMQPYFLNPDRLGAFPDNYFFLNPQEEYIDGRVVIESKEFRIHELMVVGPGFLKIDGRENEDSLVEDSQKENEELLFSRLITLFGIKAWNRWRSLRVALVGASGMGANIATMLVKSGIGRLSVWDPDILEPHIFPRTPYNLEDYYKDFNKAEILEIFLHERRFGTEVKSYPDTILKFYKYALELAKHDIIILAVDSPAARLMGTLMSKLFLIPIVDVATGFDIKSEGVRVIWSFPYETDLICFDEEIVSFESVKEVLYGTENKDMNPWYLEKRGSYYGYIGMGAGRTLMVLKELTLGKLPHSGVITDTWVEGEERLNFSLITSDRHCIPKNLLGSGISGLKDVRKWLYEKI